jgi:hypothetical protein
VFDVYVGVDGCVCIRGNQTGYDELGGEMRRKTKEEIWESIVEELCNRVGLKYPPDEGVKYKIDDATWPLDEEFDFKMWMFNYLRETTPFKRMSLRKLTSEIDWFMFAYSWKYKEEEVK